MAEFEIGRGEELETSREFGRGEEALGGERIEDDCYSACNDDSRDLKSESLCGSACGCCKC